MTVPNITLKVENLSVTYSSRERRGGVKQPVDWGRIGVVLSIANSA
jgi:hypothetical protein